METRLIKTSPAHRGYKLPVLAVPIFGILFFVYAFIIPWLGDDSIFDRDISFFGIPAIITAVLLSFIFLFIAESKLVCRLLEPILNGKPAVIFLKWLEVENDVEGSHDIYVKNGLKRLRLSCVDELSLTFFGNLIFKSRTLCGSSYSNDDNKILNHPDVVLKLPFGSISSFDQKAFIDLMRKARPDVILNRRLENRISSKIVKGEEAIKTLGAAFLFYVLADVGLTLPLYVEMHKQYYLAQVNARQSNPDGVELDVTALVVPGTPSLAVPGRPSPRVPGTPSPAVPKTPSPAVPGTPSPAVPGTPSPAVPETPSPRVPGTPPPTVRGDNLKSALTHLKRADEMRDSSVYISLVKRAIFHDPASLGATYHARAEALWYLGRQKEAIESLEKATDIFPRNLKWRTELVRWSMLTRDSAKARSILLDLIGKHEDDLLPRLYMIALEKQAQHGPIGNKKQQRLRTPGQVERFYDIFINQFDLNVFGNEPSWPLSGNSTVNAQCSRDDLRLLLPILLDLK